MSFKQKQCYDLSSYPQQYEQKGCLIRNCLVDFQIDFAYPGNRSLTIVNGLGAQKFGQSDHNYMSNEIMKRWINCAFELANQLPTSGYTYCNFCVQDLFIQEMQDL